MTRIFIMGLAQEESIVSATRAALVCFLVHLERICQVVGHPIDDVVRMLMRGEGIHYYIDMSDEDLEKRGSSVSSSHVWRALMIILLIGRQ